MKQSYLQRPSSFQEYANHNSVRCEYCFQVQSKSPFVCSHCFFLLCPTCADQHLCPATKSNSTQICSQTFVSSNKDKDECRFDQEWSKVKNCDRCIVSSATTQCLDCVIRSFCSKCFRDLHKTSKMSQHNRIQIDKSSSRYLRIDEFSEKKRIFSTSAATGSVQADAREGREKEQIQKGIMSLTSLSSRVEEKARKGVAKGRELLASVRKELEQIIQQIKLKIIELQLRMAAELEDIQSTRLKIMKEIQQKLTIYRQIDFIAKSYPNWNWPVHTKLEVLSSSLQAIVQDNQRLKTAYQQPTYHVFLEQTNSLKRQIAQLPTIAPMDTTNTFEKFPEKEDIKNQPSDDTVIVTLNNPRKSQKSAPGNLKGSGARSSKNLQQCSIRRLAPQSPLADAGISSSKSMNSFGLLTCLESKNFRKLGPQSSNSSIETPTPRYTVSSSGSIKSQRELGVSSGQNSKLLGPYNPEKGVTDPKRKGKLLKGSLGVKNSDIRHTLQFPKTGMAKALANIQNTKEQIKQMRLQMSEFNSRAANEGSFALGRKEDSFQFEEEDLDISHISIQSLVYKTAKL